MQFAYPLHISFDGYVFIFVFDLQSSHDHHYSIGNPFRQLEHSNHVHEIRIYREALGHIVYTYRSIERAGISTSYGKYSKRSHFDGELLSANQKFSGK